MGICWKRYIGPNRHPLRHRQVVISLGPIDNDHEGREACVVLVGPNNSSTCALRPECLATMTVEEVQAARDSEFEGGLR